MADGAEGAAAACWAGRRAPPWPPTMAWDQEPTSRKRVEEAFRQYRKPSRLSGCPCCVGSTGHEPLCTVNLADITPAMISPYAIKAVTTWGNVDDFKYFLPRLLELASTAEGERTLGTSASDVAAKLTYAEWTGWPEAEQLALRELAVRPITSSFGSLQGVSWVAPRALRSAQYPRSKVANARQAESPKRPARTPQPLAMRPVFIK